MALFNTPAANPSSDEVISTQRRLEIFEDMYREYGSVYTRFEVVEFILDLSGYTSDKPLHKMNILEPSFGGGEFLLSIISRLFAAWRKTRKTDLTDVMGELSNAITAVELNRIAFQTTHERVVNLLKQEGLPEVDAISLANVWLIQDDFLTHELDRKFNFVVGNPPYIRQEAIPPQQLEDYRARYQTIYDRADIYIPFIEKSLLSLTICGRLGFICADRWIKNRYGQSLRDFIDANYHLKVYVDMMGTPAFHSAVTAYPAIFIISREKSGVTRVAHRPKINKDSLKTLANLLTGDTANNRKDGIYEINRVTNGTNPWLLSLPEQTELIRRLERDFVPLEQAGCKVGIGVATGADNVFISDYQSFDIEDSRKLPLVTTRDIMKGEIEWRGKGVINPFADDGQLVNLHDYPKLQKYLDSKREIITARHCVRKNLNNWYRTIDRIIPDLLSTPKLLIPDIKGYPNVVFEEGRLYPHHNLYYITSNEWDLKALQAVLLSSIAKLFIINYSTKMRGDYLRFQAQYLRRICIPNWANTSNILRKNLIDAANKRDVSACNRIVFELYDLSLNEQILIEEAVNNGA